MICHAVSTSNHLTTFRKHRSNSPRKNLTQEAQVLRKTVTHSTDDARQWRTEGGFGGLNPPEIPKALQNRAKLNPIAKDFRGKKKGSKILKLPRFAIVLH